MSTKPASQLDRVRTASQAAPVGGSAPAQIRPTRDPAQARRDLDEFGLALLEGALGREEAADVRAKLVAAIARSEALGVRTRGYEIDPNRFNVRVFNLFNLDPIFVDLIQREVALEFVRHLIGDAFLISNFTANVALPGSQSMVIHSDQGLSMPGPWPIPLAINVAWLLDDCDEENGATRYVPGTQRSAIDGPDPARAYTTVPIEAPAGSLMVMDGRLWHTSGANQSRDRERAILFGYYTAPHLRPQVNWNAALLPEVAKTLSLEFLDRLGCRWGNVGPLIGYEPRLP